MDYPEFVHVLAWVVVGLSFGWLIQAVTHQHTASRGLQTNIVVGITGALAGGALAGVIGLKTEELAFGISLACVGAAVFLFILNVALPKRREPVVQDPVE